MDGDYEVASKIVEVDTSAVEGPIIRPQENVATAGWFIGMMLAIAFLILVLILVCVIKRNRGGKYVVHEREAAAGRAEQDEPGFQEYSQPLGGVKGPGGGRRPSGTSGEKPGGGGAGDSDSDSMAEYGEGDTGNFIFTFFHNFT